MVNMMWPLQNVLTITSMNRSTHNHSLLKALVTKQQQQKRICRYTQVLFVMPLRGTTNTQPLPPTAINSTHRCVSAYL